MLTLCLTEIYNLDQKIHNIRSELEHKKGNLAQPLIKVSGLLSTPRVLEVSTSISDPLQDQIS